MPPIRWKMPSSSCLETEFSRFGRAIASWLHRVSESKARPSELKVCPTSVITAKGFEVPSGAKSRWM
jgi:hypothetical protein